MYQYVINRPGTSYTYREYVYQHADYDMDKQIHPCKTVGCNSWSIHYITTLEITALISNYNPPKNKDVLFRALIPVGLFK